jgi:hypothetical protein
MKKPSSLSILLGGGGLHYQLEKKKKESLNQIYLTPI